MAKVEVKFNKQGIKNLVKTLPREILSGYQQAINNIARKFKKDFVREAFGGRPRLNKESGLFSGSFAVVLANQSTLGRLKAEIGTNHPAFKVQQGLVKPNRTLAFPTKLGKRIAGGPVAVRRFRAGTYKTAFSGPARKLFYIPVKNNPNVVALLVERSSKSGKLKSRLKGQSKIGKILQGALSRTAGALKKKGIADDLKVHWVVIKPRRLPNRLQFPQTLQRKRPEIQSMLDRALINALTRSAARRAKT